MEKVNIKPIFFKDLNKGNIKIMFKTLFLSMSYIVYFCCIVSFILFKSFLDFSIRFYESQSKNKVKKQKIYKHKKYKKYKGKK